MKLKVVTLNCWGVFTPLACEKRHERLAAIADVMSEGENDIVFLQEIWTDGDYDKIRKKMLKSYPHSQYFHSNLIGSGCCIFSRYPIEETFFYRYAANGFPHRLQHGDWFGGKGVGMARIRLPGDLTLACYVTHLHAQYSREKDEYLPHRVSQAHELSTFLRLTSAGADAALLCGDLNLSPDTLGLRLLLANSGLKDAWVEHAGAAACEDKEGVTCDRPGNSFTSKLKPFPERLDYVLFGSTAGTRIDCLDCRLALGKVPGQSYNYSDHEAVQAEFELTRSVTQPAILGPNLAARRDLLTRCLPVMQEGVSAAKRDRIYFAGCLLLALVLLFCASNLLGAGFLGLPIIVADSIYIFFLVWTIIVVKQAEIRAMTNTLHGMERLLAAED
ncbi:hypothetical protein BOX15_Mlig025338g3 [Macrostomum lignano]|uniref:sphingomyelin phosphodiesterase n=1 Tax=Macrostomum lignano TaxID=282301 RepID=A0A267H1I2_9PLAT|nr:hypothetical protein BOX15_Mlig025338g3 [Macrostomum lignano]